MLKFRFPFIKNWIGYLYYFVVLFEAYFNVTVCTVWLFLFYKGSVLTRILPWGVPGPPLLRNRDPVRTLGGQSCKKHAVLNCLVDFFAENLRSKLIRRKFAVRHVFQ